MKNVILYVRVSTDEQAGRGYSLRDQEQKLLTYCENNNLNVLHIFREDFSAKTFKRPEFKKLLDVGFVDSFRHLHSDAKYTYWSNFHNAREKNKGWRIDLGLVSDKNIIREANCLTEYKGSDHAPILLEI